jgi:hypothetical protein
VTFGPVRWIVYAPRQIGVAEIEPRQLGGLAVDPQRAADVREPAIARGLEHQANEAAVSPLPGCQAEAMRLCKPSAPEDLDVRTVEDTGVALEHHPAIAQQLFRGRGPEPGLICARTAGPALPPHGTAEHVEITFEKGKLVAIGLSGGLRYGRRSLADFLPQAQHR